MSMSTVGIPVELPIKVGTELLVEFQNFTLKTKSELVGMKRGQYLIIGMLHDMVGIRTDEIKESPLIIRYLYRGSVYGFMTRTLNIVNSPDRLIFLSYPEKIEEFRVRSSHRFECILPAATSLDGSEAETVIVDISNDGCRCIIQSSGVKDPDNFYKALDINRVAVLKVQFPGTSDSYELSGTIRNISKDADRIAFGVQFGPIRKETKSKFEDFINLISQLKK